MSQLRRNNHKKHKTVRGTKNQKRPSASYYYNVLGKPVGYKTSYRPRKGGKMIQYSLQLRKNGSPYWKALTSLPKKTKRKNYKRGGAKLKKSDAINYISTYLRTRIQTLDLKADAAINYLYELPGGFETGSNPNNATKRGFILMDTVVDGVAEACVNIKLQRPDKPVIEDSFDNQIVNSFKQGINNYLSQNEIEEDWYPWIKNKFLP
jgi:hypothetical protein